MVGPGRCLAGPKGARPLPTDLMGPLRGPWARARALNLSSGTGAGPQESAKVGCSFFILPELDLGTRSRNKSRHRIRAGERQIARFSLKCDAPRSRFPQGLGLGRFATFQPKQEAFIFHCPNFQSPPPQMGQTCHRVRAGGRHIARFSIWSVRGDGEAEPRGAQTRNPAILSGARREDSPTQRKMAFKRALK